MRVYYCSAAVAPYDKKMHLWVYSPHSDQTSAQAWPIAKERRGAQKYLGGVRVSYWGIDWSVFSAARPSVPAITANRLVDLNSGGFVVISPLLVFSLCPGLRALQ